MSDSECTEHQEPVRPPTGNVSNTVRMSVLERDEPVLERMMEGFLQIGDCGRYWDK